MNTTVYSTAAWSLRDHAQRWSAVMQLALQDIRASRGFGCLPAKSEERLLLAEEEARTGDQRNRAIRGITT